MESVSKKQNFKNIIATSVVFLFIFAVYSFLYFYFQQNGQYVGEFIYDYALVSKIVSSNFNFIDLFKPINFYSGFISNLLVFVNVEYFSYSLEFIKITNYVLKALLLVGITLTLGKNKKAYCYVANLFLAFVILDFFGIYDSFSGICITASLVVGVFSFFFLDLFATSKSFFRWISFAVGLVLTFTNNSIFEVIILIYFLLKRFHNTKLYVKITSLVAALIFIVFYLCHFIKFVDVSNLITLENFQESFYHVCKNIFIPFDRLLLTEYSYILQNIGIYCGLIYLIVCCLSFFTSKKIYLEKLVAYLGLLIVIGLQILFVKEFEYFDACTFKMCSIFVGFLIAESIDHIYEKIKYRGNSKSSVFFNPSALSLVSAIIPFLVGVLISAQLTFNIYDDRETISDGLNYCLDYDYGALDTEYGYYFDDRDESLKEKYEFYKTNNLLDGESIELAQDTSQTNLSSVEFLRGVYNDAVGQKWVGNNFAFKAYVDNGFLTLRFYMPFDSALTLYINNVQFEKQQLPVGNIYLRYDVSEFYQKQVIVRGDFDDVYALGNYENGVWAGQLIGITFSNSLGIYAADESGKVWTENEFGYFLPQTVSSYDFNFYYPFEDSNSVTCYIDDIELSSCPLSLGSIAWNLDLTNYVGNKHILKFVFENKHFSNEGLPLGIIYGGYIAKPTKEFSFTTEITGPFTKLNFLSSTVTLDNFVSVKINGNEVASSSLDKTHTEMLLKTADYLGQSVTISGEFTEYVAENSPAAGVSSFSSEINYGLYTSDGDGQWCRKSFGFYVDQECPYYRFNFFYIYDDTNVLDVFVNAEKKYTVNVSHGFNYCYIDLSDYGLNKAYIEFELDHAPYIENQTRELGIIFNGYSNNFIKEYKFNLDITNEFVLLEFLELYLNQIEYIKVYLNNEFYGEFKARDNDALLSIKTHKFKGQNIEIKLVYDDWVENTGNNGGIKQLRQEEKSGFYFYNETLEWTRKCFSFFAEDTSLDRNVTIFYPYDDTNNISCYVNGTLIITRELVHGFNYIPVELSFLNGESCYLDFEVESTHTSSADVRNLGCIYEGMTSCNLTKKIDLCIDVVQPFLTVSVNEALYSSNSDLKVKINGGVEKVFKVEERLNSFGLNLSEFIGDTVTISIEFDNPVDSSVGEYINDNLVQNDTYGFYSPDGATQWVKPNFGVGLIPTKNKVEFGFYEISENLPNALDIYLNGEYYGEIELTGFDVLEIDVSEYIGSLVTFEFVAKNAFYSQDWRVFGCVLSYYREID